MQNIDGGGSLEMGITTRDETTEWLWGEPLSDFSSFLKPKKVKKLAGRGPPLDTFLLELDA